MHHLRKSHIVLSAVFLALLLGASVVVSSILKGAGPPVLTDSAASAAITRYFTTLTADDYVVYTDPLRGFSLHVPKDFTVSTSSEGDRDLVLFRHPVLPAGFEIVSRPIAKNHPPLTPEDVIAAVPGLSPDSVVGSSLADDTPAVRFPYHDNRELWFIRKGYLYQISMYSANQDWLDAWIRQLATDLTF